MQSLKAILLNTGLLVLLSLSALRTTAQSATGWEILTDVTFEEQYDENIDGYWLIPNFGKKLRAHQNKPLTVEGYFIPIDPDDGFFVLSKFPYAACFFCGGAGPESVIELNVKKSEVEHIRLDQKVTFTGKLQLNRSDFDHCNYILKEAKLIKP
jgi:hypothetical protein